MASTSMVFDLLAKDVNASATFAKVAIAAKSAGKALEGVGSSSASLAKLVLPTALIPTLAVAGSQVASLGTALVSAAGAGGIFGLAVAGQVHDMVAAREAIKKTREKLAGLKQGTKEYRQTLAALHTQQAQFNKDFGPAARGWDDMKVAFTGFKNATRTTTLSVIGKALELVASILPRLIPVANGAGKAIGKLLDQMQKWTYSPGFQKVLDWLGTSGVQNITRFGHIVGDVLLGLGRVFGHFTGSGDKVAASAERLAAAFAKWAGSRQATAAIQRFMGYAKQNGPAVAKVIGSLAKILPQMVTALSGMGSITLTGVSGFLGLLARLPPKQFRILAQSIVGVAIAVRAWKVATNAWSVATSVATAVMGVWNAMTSVSLAELPVLIGLYLEAARGTKAWAVVQAILNAVMDANPIGIVIVAIAALAAGLIYAYKHSETFRNIVNGAFHAIATAAKWMWNSVLKPTFQFLVSAFLNVAGAIIHGAAKAFGWIPGIGSKLRAAAGWFDNFKQSVNNKLSGIHNRNVKIDANATTANSAIVGVRNNLASLHDKTVTVTVRSNNTTVSYGGGHGRIATGTPYWHGGMATVGEHGPEQVVLPRGSRVIPNEASGGTGGDLGTFTVVVAGEDGRIMQRKLLKLKRTNGGKSLGLA